MNKGKLIETSISILSINDYGVAEMHFKDHVTMDIPEQMDHLKGIINLTKNHPTPFIITAGEHVVFTKEAKENAPVIEEKSPVCASAIVVENLAYRLLADFFIKMQKPKTPYKTFTSKDKAIEWCKQFVTPNPHL